MLTSLKQLLAHGLRAANLLVRGGYYYPLLHKRLLGPSGFFRNTRVRCRYDDTLQFNAHLGDWIQHHIFFMGHYEPQLTRWIKNELPAGAVVLDIGANVGAFSLLFAKYAGPAGRVIAVEPHPQNASLLRANLQLNQLTQVVVVTAAVGSSGALVQLDGFDPRNQGLVRSRPLEGGAFGAASLVAPQLSGDALVAELDLQRLDLIKIDAEGADLDILHSLRGSIAKHLPNIIFEFQPRQADARNILTELMETHGYRLKLLDGTPLSVEALSQLSSSSTELNVLLERPGA